MVIPKIVGPTLTELTLKSVRPAIRLTAVNVTCFWINLIINELMNVILVLHTSKSVPTWKQSSKERKIWKFHAENSEFPIYQVNMYPKHPLKHSVRTNPNKTAPGTGQKFDLYYRKYNFAVFVLDADPSVMKLSVTHFAPPWTWNFWNFPKEIRSVLVNEMTF